MKATIVDLRYNMKEVMRAIDRGETVDVFCRGKQKAKLTPVADQSTAAQKGAIKVSDSPLFGMWRDREDMVDPSAYIRGLREPRKFPLYSTVKKRSAAKKVKKSK